MSLRVFVSLTGFAPSCTASGLVTAAPTASGCASLVSATKADGSETSGIGV